MTLTAESLAERLDALACDAPPLRYVVAFSGGLDSSVLLHALVAAKRDAAVPILAAHVDHRLQPESRDWARHCERIATALGVGYSSEAVQVEASEEGIEAAARRARYGCFERLLVAGDWLLSAHHEDDQAETLLLNLLRGSGPLGLAGIAATRPLGAGLLVRPLLDVPRAALEEYADREALDWQDDPSNRDTRFDRNYLRNEVMPLLRERWPAASARLATSAGLAAQASALLDDLAALDLEEAGRADRLDIGSLLRLDRPRQRNLLRHAIRQAGLSPAPATRLEQILDETLTARPDAEPLVRWSDAEARRYRDALYLLRALPPTETHSAVLAPGEALDLGRGVGRLWLERGEGPGIDPTLVEAGLSVHFRGGGERLRPACGARSRKLKTLMQDAGIVPWMRDRIPLISADAQLVAVADLWLGADTSVESGYVVRWDQHPALH